MIYQVLRDADGHERFTYVSQGVRELFNCTPQQAMSEADYIYSQVLPEDLPALAGAVIERLSRKMGKPVREITTEGLRNLASHRFPGNVRELENILERAIIFTDSETIEASDLDVPEEASGRAGGSVQARNLGESAGSRSLHPQPASLKSMEKRAIADALRRWEGNRTRAAEELGITRRTLINKIREYGIDL